MMKIQNGLGMDKEYFNLFPVIIQKVVLELNIDFLIEFCYEMKRKNEKGVEFSNVGGWHSDNLIDETHTEFVKLKNKIEEAANLYHHEMQLKKTYNQKIDNIWININQKGHSNEWHIHAGAFLSGAFYLAKGETPIVFRHPFNDINEYYWKPFVIEKTNNVNSGGWTLDPEPNMLIIFPAWVYHKVSMNKEDIDRISFSFNTVIHEIEKGNG